MRDSQKRRTGRLMRLSIIGVSLLMMGLEISWSRTQNSIAASSWTIKISAAEPVCKPTPPIPVARPDLETPVKNKTALARPNYALASKGADAIGSSAAPGYAASGAIDGDERGLNFGKDGYWSTADDSLPAWLEVNFHGNRTIEEIDVFSIQDDYTSPIQPDLTTTFSKYGLVKFEVQYWASGVQTPLGKLGFWTDVPVAGNPVTGNMNVLRRFTFTELTTPRIRVLVTNTPDGYSRIAELEAWGK